MKKFLIAFFKWAAFAATAQTKKPTLMVLPSDNWCETRYFMTEFDNQGTKQKVPNYKQAFQDDTELGQVISKIGGLMVDRGFPLKDVEQEIKAIEARNAEDNMSSSTTSGSSMAESPLDKLKNKAQADILIQIWWKVTKTEDGKVVSFVLEAFDAYTSKRIASSSGNSAPNKTDIVPVMLQNAILANMEPFANQIQKHFDDMFNNGREITLTVKKWSSWDKDFETEIDGKEITDYIDEWMKKIKVERKHLETIFNHDYVHGALHVFKDHMSYENVPIRSYDQKDNIFYIFTNANIWCEMTQQQFDKMMDFISKQFIHEFVLWQNENKHRMEDDNYAMTYMKNIRKMNGGNNTTTEQLYRKIHRELYKNTKTSLNVNQYDVVIV
jgi:hypothetical protein